MEGLTTVWRRNCMEGLTRTVCPPNLSTDRSCHSHTTILRLPFSDCHCLPCREVRSVEGVTGLLLTILCRSCSVASSSHVAMLQPGLPPSPASCTARPAPPTCKLYSQACPPHQQALQPGLPPHQ